MMKDEALSVLGDRYENHSLSGRAQSRAAAPSIERQCS